MSFVANGSITPSHISISNTEFFPSISMDEIRNVVRIETTVSDDRLRQYLLEEIIDANRLLVSLKAKAATLKDLAESMIDGQPDTEILYFSAISNGVAAKVNENYRNYDSTNSGNKKAEHANLTADDYRRNKMWAIQQLKRENHTIVELI